MLSDILKRNIYSFEDHFDSWEDAIRASYKTMINEDIVEDGYVDKVIECVKTFGPYIVIAPMIAMPHSTEGANGVKDTAVGFMKVKQPVHFDLEDSEKDAQLFFPLAALDHDQHLQNIMSLSEMLMNEDLVRDLLLVNSKEELEDLAKKYNI